MENCFLKYSCFRFSKNKTVVCSEREIFNLEREDYLDGNINSRNVLHRRDPRNNDDPYGKD